MNMKKAEYYITIKGSKNNLEYVPVNGKVFKREFEGCTFLFGLGRPFGKKTGWVISELSTGLKFVSGLTQEEVFDKFERQLEAIGSEYLENQINHEIDHFGIRKENLHLYNLKFNEKGQLTKK